jgi:hypothetical protein
MRKTFTVSSGDAAVESEYVPNHDPLPEPDGIPPWGYSALAAASPPGYGEWEEWNRKLDDKVLGEIFDKWLEEQQNGPARTRVEDVPNGIMMYSEYSEDYITLLKMSIPRQSYAWIPDAKAWWVSTEYAEQGRAIFELFFSDKPLDIIELGE